MSEADVVYAVDWSYYLSQPLIGGTGKRLGTLHYADGTIRLKHACKVVDGRLLVCAPALQLANGGHRVVQERPLTIEPSVLCPDCGTHGFIRAGRWEAA